MAKHRIYQKYESIKEKGRREWFHNWDYYYDDETGDVVVESYQSVEEIPYSGPMRTYREEGTLEVIVNPELPVAAKKALEDFRRKNKTP